MSFAYPWMLWALPAAAVPIIIHLLQRRRQHRLDFAAMEFLLRAMRRTRRRIFLEDLLLLLLRTLAVIFLVLALARPSTDDLPLIAARPKQTEILVLDASLSMEHREAGRTAYERALEVAARRVDALDGGRGDRAALIRAGLQAERLAAGDPAEVRAALDELTRAEAGITPMEDALVAALRTADTLPPADERNVRVTVLTDLQATTWPLDGPAVAALARIAEGGDRVEVVDVGARTRANVAVTGLDLSATRIVRGDVVDATARVRNFGSTPATVEARMLLEGDPIGRRSLTLRPGEEQAWTVPLSPVELGARGIEVRIEHDALVDDDARAAVLAVEEALRLGVVGEYAPAGSTPGVFDALLRYFDLGEQAPLRAELLPPARVDAERLEEVDVAVLADPGRLGPLAAEALAEFVRGGGGLLVAFGPRTGDEDFAALRDALDLGGVRVGTPTSAREEHARLEILQPRHPALRFFDDPQWRPLLTEVPFARFRPLAVDAEEADEMTRPLRFVTADEDGEAGDALVEAVRGAGRVVLLAATPCPTWNGMEEVPGGTLPFLYDLVFHLAPQPGFPPSVEVGEALTVTLDRTPTDVVLRDPDGLRLSSVSQVQPLAGGRARVELVERARRPGIWVLEAHVLLADGEQVPRTVRLAVATPPEESRLEAVDRGALANLLPPSVLLSGIDAQTVISAEDGEGERGITRWFLALVLAMLAGETVLARILDRRRAA